MIDMKDELLYDFSINSSRILITDKLALIDNVDKIIDFTDKEILIQSGKNSYTALKGLDMSVSSFQGSRIVCTGSIRSVEFISPEDRTD